MQLTDRQLRMLTLGLEQIAKILGVDMYDFDCGVLVHPCSASGLRLDGSIDPTVGLYTIGFKEKPKKEEPTEELPTEQQTA